MKIYFFTMNQSAFKQQKVSQKTFINGDIHIRMQMELPLKEILLPLKLKIMVLQFM